MSSEATIGVFIQPDASAWLEALASEWLKSQEVVAYYQGGTQQYPRGSFPQMLAVGLEELLRYKPNTFFETLEAKCGKWWLGFIGYGLRTQVEQVPITNPSPVDFPESYLFSPKLLLRLLDHETIEATGPWAEYWLAHRNLPKSLSLQVSGEPMRFGEPMAWVKEEAYQQGFDKIKHHIAEGDVYELNYCVPFTAVTHGSDPSDMALAMLKEQDAPFGAVLKMDQRFIISLSPERYLKKQGKELVCQPMKGTAPRAADPEVDHANAQKLRESEKERAENMMIVDLVRNDMARASIPGTVAVTEMFGVYPFARVHQMISTITGYLTEGNSGLKALKYAFPMGSMTGAPKVRAMQIIDEVEAFERGPYSGALGYITPSGDYDFNVLIRSLFIDTPRRMAFFAAGGAITWDATAHDEWAEIQLKASHILATLARYHVKS